MTKEKFCTLFFFGNDFKILWLEFLFSTFRNSYPSYEEAFTIDWMASLVKKILVGDMAFYFEDVLQ
jgi:hypothetical protein